MLSCRWIPTFSGSLGRLGGLHGGPLLFLRRVSRTFFRWCRCPSPGFPLAVPFPHPVRPLVFFRQLYIVMVSGLFFFAFKPEISRTSCSPRSPFGLTRRVFPCSVDSGHKALCRRGEMVFSGSLPPLLPSGGTARSFFSWDVLFRLIPSLGCVRHYDPGKPRPRSRSSHFSLFLKRCLGSLMASSSSHLRSSRLLV